MATNGGPRAVRTAASRSAALPVSSTATRDGGWAYELYASHGIGDTGYQESPPGYRGTPFIVTLDRRRHRTARQALGTVGGRHDAFNLALRLRHRGRILDIVDRSASSSSRTLFRLDTAELRQATRAPRRAATRAPRRAATRAPRQATTRGREQTTRLPAGGFLGFTQTARHPGNLLERVGVAGRSLAGRPIRIRQLGDPVVPGRLLVFDCIHGNECAATGRIQPLANGCPDPAANIYIVPNLNPDGLAMGHRGNRRGVDLNRNFPTAWKPIGSPGDPEYAGPRPFSEPESRLAARVIRRLRPDVTIWFHQDAAARPFVRAWGQSVPTARRFARLAGISFRLMGWLPGTAPNWQNHRFAAASSFVVETPRGAVEDGLWVRLSTAVDRLGRKVGED